MIIEYDYLHVLQWNNPNVIQHDYQLDYDDVNEHDHYGDGWNEYDLWHVNGDDDVQ